MASEKHLQLLKQGDVVWNQWRQTHPEITPDLAGARLNRAWLRRDNLSRANLSQADLSEANLTEADFTHATLTEANLTHASLTHANLRGANLHRAAPWGANLKRARLSGATLTEANLRGATLHRANLRGATLTRADLRGADFTHANLRGAILTRADLSGATLRGANLSGATLHRTDLCGADLTSADLSGAIFIDTQLNHTRLSGCRVYGIFLWGVQLDGAEQLNLIITRPDQLPITVDHLKVAQFIHLLLNNGEIRDVIDPLARKAVLILGRFTLERKALLDALKDALRTQGYLPVLFDVEKPSSQDLTETVSTLAHLSRFILVDLTDPSSAPYEVDTIASNQIKPIQVLFQSSDEAKRVFAMFPDLVRRYHWVLPPYEYQDQAHLLASLQAHIIEPAEWKAQELERR